MPHGGSIGSSSSKPDQTNLHSYIQSSRPPPDSTATSQEIRDRGSIFVANIFQASSVEEVNTRIQHVKHVLHGSKPASHEISAWRIMGLKSGRSGLGGPDDFQLITGSEDDGEKWAGNQILKVMQIHAIIDAVVIVSRWYGGTLLGPARFSHIRTSASEVCLAFKKLESLRECISTLSTLDVILAELRSEYNILTGSGIGESSKQAAQNYSTLDLGKGKRLIKARENAIKNVKLLLAKRQTNQ
ncbi:ribosomal protein S5 domain 2-type protein [Collybia nuda]|uniref:Ribosomal protein S5 domain 2-type protein n=1 Tax=Collybia nuda TaxID=64659 RepID=A0A9P6CQ84_9AGAR|nr:ribosomal protein S5 domain 2-type protein [Collybia nuda]